MAKRLLLVDDHPRNLTLLVAMLGPLGHEIITVDGGAAAIARFDTEPIDLVLMDLMMPTIDGLAVLRHIRQHPHRSHIPVILVTIHSEREHRLRALEAGADEFLEKPIDRAILWARVRTLLQLKDSRDELQASRDALAGRNVELEELQREQRELTQFIVHDLKSPLSVVVGNLDWAEENVGGRTEDLAAALSDASIAASRMRDMIDDLLTVARLEDAEFPVQSEVVAVADLLRPVVDIYTRKADAKSVSLLAPGDIDRTCKVRGDPSLLRRVLENILDNSLRYTPPSGRVAIAVQPGALVQIRISNTGPPILPAERKMMFQKFVRGATDSSGVGNAGLGLYFCKCAIEAQLGTIKVSDLPEWSTNFVIELPAAP